MKASAGEHAKYNADAGSLPINCVSTEGLVPSHCPFHTRPVTPKACQLAIKLFLPLHPVLSLGSGSVMRMEGHTILLCQLLRYFPGIYPHIRQTLYFPLFPPPSFYSTHPILFLLWNSIVKTCDRRWIFAQKQSNCGPPSIADIRQPPLFWRHWIAFNWLT